MAKKSKTVEIEASNAADTEIDAMQAELDKFLSSNLKIPVEALGNRDFTDSFIDTGNLAYNFIMSHKMRTGGIAKNKITTLEGERERGKSILCTLLGVNNIIDKGVTYYNDVEDGLNIDFAKKASNNPEAAEKIKVISITTLEELSAFLNKVIDYNASKKKKERPHILVLIDSWSILTSIKELAESRKVDVAKKAKDMTKSQEARAMIRTITPMLRESNMSIVAVLHTTMKIGVVFGNPETQASHGTALMFGASQACKVMATAGIKKREADNFDIGVRMHIKAVKNRVVHKGKEVWMDVYFAGG